MDIEKIVSEVVFPEDTRQIISWALHKATDANMVIALKGYDNKPIPEKQ